MIKFNKKLVKVHVGCGTHLLEDWINCDIKGENVDVKWDITEKPPFDFNSVDFLFCEHVLEHFTLDEGIKVLSVFRKILKPGGRIRITVPDLKSCIDSYLTGYGFKFRNEHQKHLPPARVNADFINKCFREFGHKFLYDEDALVYALSKANFIDTCAFAPLESDQKQLIGIERRIKGENSAQHSLCIEAVKKTPSNK